MKFTITSILTSTAMFFALCASVVACGPGGGYRSNSYSYPTYQSVPSFPSPIQSSTSFPSPISTANATQVAPITPNLESSVAPAAPQARISVVPTVSSNGAPVGRLQIASPVAGGNTAKASIREIPSTDTTPTVTKIEPKADSAVTKIEPKTNDKMAKVEPKSEGGLDKSLDSLNAPTGAVSKIADAIKGLVGTWMAVSRQGDGELSTVELKLDDNGWATLTVPGADGKSSTTTTRKVEFENNELKLTGGDADVMLGKLVEFNSRQMVLERSGGQVTFVRP